jgi:CRISPR-associated protein Csm5
MTKAQITNYHITAETLTPVHIGSGRELQYNTDYLYFEKLQRIGVIHPEKVLAVIGAENIDTWVTYINQQTGIDQYITKILKKSLLPDDVSSRVIGFAGSGLRRQAVKEQLHNGAGMPYIPGSSLKGALRTALLVALIGEDDGFVADKTNLQKQIRRRGQTENIFDDSRMMRHYFGNDPNHDFMRLMRAGDVHFDKTTCFLVNTVNLFNNSWRIKEQINQYAECIPPGLTAIGNLKLFDYGNLAGNLIHPNLRHLFDGGLFELINNYTQRWINNEIAFWDDEGDGDIEREYIGQLLEIEKISKRCTGNSFVLRVGFGGGFASMTGDWQFDHMEEDDYNDLVDQLRHPRYKGMLFPKTRKFTSESQPLGFIKITAQPD